MTSRHDATDSVGVPSCAASWANARVSPTPDAAADSSCWHPACVRRREASVYHLWHQGRPSSGWGATGLSGASASYVSYPRLSMCYHVGEARGGCPGFWWGRLWGRTRLLRVAIHRALVPITFRFLRLLPHERAPHALPDLLRRRRHLKGAEAGKRTQSQATNASVRYCVLLEYVRPWARRGEAPFGAVLANHTSLQRRLPGAAR
jgi:hypothetical protein